VPAAVAAPFWPFKTAIGAKPVFYGEISDKLIMGGVEILTG
jgi:hypothetical protein